MDEENLEEQYNELLALESIYSCNDDVLAYKKLVEEGVELNNNTSGPVPLHKGHVSCAVKLEADIEIIATSNAKEYKGQISYLPPLYLSFLLNSDYPSKNPPCFTLAASWLTTAAETALTSRLSEIWSENEGMPILFLWIQCLEEETAVLLGLTFDLASCSSDARSQDESFSDAKAGARKNSFPDTHKNSARKRSVSSGPHNNSLTAEHFAVSYTPIQLFNILVDYDSLQRRKEFERSNYLCDVCFIETPGTECLQFLPCRHVFCQECISGYFEFLIKEGSVRKLKCLGDKCESIATPQQVREAVKGNEAYERYESLLLRNTLDLMSDVVPCPRVACQGPVILDKETGDVNPSSTSTVERIMRMATCPTCNFTFCTYCRKGYHGIASCSFSSKEATKLANEYQSADPEVQKRMEFRYGKETMVKLVNEALAEAWIGENSKKCPQCNVNIEKKDGCNKMWCWRCSCYFCWLCFSVLSKENPYAHFNKPGGNCYNKLFYGMEEEWDDDDLAALLN